MKTPEEALAQARRVGAANPVSDLGDESSAEEVRQRSVKRLAVWAIIEPDEAEVYSTRRLGWPITLLKRALIRLLRQYILQISAQQSRFNAHLAAHVIALDERVRELERRSDQLPK